MRARERGSVVALIMGLLLLGYPLVNVPNRPMLVLGVPLLYLYLFTLWLAGIAAAWLLSRNE
jgi:hypothetical protein